MPKLLLVLLILMPVAVVSAQTVADLPAPPKTESVVAEAAADDVAGPEETAAQPAPEKPFDLLNNTRLTGDWWGGRRRLKDRGIEFGLSLTTVYQHNAHGGLQTHNGHRTAGSADYELTLDSEGLGLWKGGTLYVAAESSWNNDLADRVGNLFGTNFDAVGDSAIVVNELWYEHKLLDGKARFRLGKMYSPNDFDTNAYANDETAQFLNPALVNTGNLPFPDYGVGAQVVVQPTDWFYAGILVADAQTNHRQTGLNTTFHDEDYFFSAAEFGFQPVWETPGGKLPGGYRFGLWYDPQPKEEFFDDLDGEIETAPLKRDDVGFYVSLDQLVLKENPRDDADAQGLGVFARYGYAHAEVNEVENFWSVGGQYQGLIPTRDDDVLAFGVAQGLLSERMKRQGDTPHRETVLELYYRLTLTPWLALTPDFQWVLDPGGMGIGRDAFVAGLRLQASF